MMPAQVKAITLRQVLTMTAGLPPDRPDDPAYVRTGDWVAAILREGTQQRSVLDYAREKLFTPLGISTIPAAEPVAREENLAAYNRARFAWPTDPQGNYVGFTFLKLTARDMDKLGRLWLNG